MAPWALAGRRRGKGRGGRRFQVHKPGGTLHPRVQAAGPERFGVVCVDCAKARSKWMLADFYGQTLIPPTPVEHTRTDFEAALARLRKAVDDHRLTDLIIAVERTGRYHLPARRAFAAAGYEVRIVHPFATKQFRQPADPGNKTDDTDLAALHRAAVNGFGLAERDLDPVHEQLRLLARHRRDLVRKAVVLRCQIQGVLEALMPGYAGCFDDIFSSNIALPIARHTGSAAAVRRAGAAGLARFLREAGVRTKAPSLARVAAWAETAADGPEHPEASRRILAALEDDRRAKAREVMTVERDLAALLVQTPYLLLLSIPGINVASAAELAGEMGPIGHYASARAITGRAGLFPSRYQSDQVDRASGPLVRCGNRTLRQAILMIADNLLRFNDHFRGLAARWREAGKDPRDTHVKVGGRFCRVAYQMVAGRGVFHHPCCQRRDFIIEKMIKFQNEHETPLPRALADLEAAAAQLPRDEYPAEAAPLAAALERPRRGMGHGPVLVGAILPVILARLGVKPVQSRPSGESDRT
jgi:transposase